MGTIWIKEFTGGLDTRRMPETTAGGVLIVAKDGHINRGGEFEQRAAFIPTYTLPSGTIGLAYTPTGIVVFGSAAAPTMPTGVTYQRLQHSDLTTALVDVPSWDLFAGKIYAVGVFADGSRFHFYDGVRVTDWADGRARAAFRVTGGTAAPQSALTGMTVNGVQIIGATVNWATSNEATASAIAGAINSFTSIPDYTAVAIGDTVNIIAATAGATANGYGVGMAVTNGLVLAPTGLTLQGGQDNAPIPGTYVQTLSSKLYSVSGPNLHFSGVSAPAKWTTSTTGAGFIDMSSQAAGAEQLTAVAKYQTFVAVFAERVIVIEYVDPDPSNNKISQVLYNTGTASPRSVTQFGDNDVFYLDESGVRSLRARNASTTAATIDTGVPVDSLVTAKLQQLTTTDRDRISGLIEPREGRFWLSLKDQIFVFSYFPGAKVSAWSTYSPGFNVDTMLAFKRQVYVRSADTIYVYGGLGSTPVYDATVAEAWLPYLDAGAPTRKKQFQGLDAAVEGLWEVSAGMEPTELDTEDLVARVSGTTFNQERIPFEHAATHVSLRFRSQGVGPHKVGAAVVHFEGKADED